MLDKIPSRLYERPGQHAPRNRTLFLTDADSATYSRIPVLEDLRAVANFQEALDIIYHGDCLEGLTLVPSRSVDLVFADPPYNLGKDFGNGSDKRSEEEYHLWTEEWLTEVQRVLKPSGSVYVCSDWRRSGAIQSTLGRLFKVKNRITWRREKGRGSRRNWKNNMEDIWFAVASRRYVFHADAVKMKKKVIAPYRENGRPKDWEDTKDGRFRMTYASNIWTDTIVPFWSMYENTPHPAQKPEMVVERVIQASSDPGAIVLDPFMGSGTTAVVARRLGRRFLGFELNSEYVRLALKRLDSRLATDAR